MKRAILPVIFLLSAASAVHAQSVALDIDPTALEMRDPFKRMVGGDATVVVAAAPRERFSVEQFKMVGAITGTGRVRAILQDPEGRTHLVYEKMRIGPRKGVILEIRSNVVRVRERVPDALGKDETIDTDLKLMSARKAGEGA
jgi:Tfp pilus assembly protein PilP